MARQFLPKDVHALMNALVYQATGQKDMSVVDTSTFVDAGTKLIELGTENVMNAISILIGKTVVASRSYSGKFKLIHATEQAYGLRFRKISFYARNNSASGMYNTDLNTNLGRGLDDESGVGSQWEQNPAIPVQMDFYSEAAYDKWTTIYPEQMKVAFRDESEFLAFMNGILTEVWNDIESTDEAKSRIALLDRIAGTIKMVKDGKLGNESAVNLLVAFNEEYGTNYTKDELLQEHTTAFLEYLTAKVQIDSDRMTNRTTAFHDSMEKQINENSYFVLRHTPKTMQRMIYYKPFFTMAKAKVLPEIFNTQYIATEYGEGVDYWQDFNKPTAIDIKPALPEGVESEEIKEDMILAVLFDKDALMVQNQFNSAYTTPINARHVYQNTFWHYKFGVIQDYTENFIVYYIADVA